MCWLQCRVPRSLGSLGLFISWNVEGWIGVARATCHPLALSPVSLDTSFALLEHPSNSDGPADPLKSSFPDAFVPALGCSWITVLFLCLWKRVTYINSQKFSQAQLQCHGLYSVSAGFPTALYQVARGSHLASEDPVRKSL